MYWNFTEMIRVELNFRSEPSENGGFFLESPLFQKESFFDVFLKMKAAAGSRCRNQIELEQSYY